MVISWCTPIIRANSTPLAPLRSNSRRISSRFSAGVELPEVFGRGFFDGLHGTRFSLPHRPRIRSNLNGSFQSVKELAYAITDYLAERNLNPTRYEWRTKGADILTKIQRARQKQETLEHRT